MEWISLYRPLRFTIVAVQREEEIRAVAWRDVMS